MAMGAVYSLWESNHCAGPVSYTHLDVYKRQEQERRRAKKAEYNRRYMEKKRRQWKEQQEREKEQQEALESVSYTHLDVYKRQGQPSGCLYIVSAFKK